jgi:hypothetical protein
MKLLHDCQASFLKAYNFHEAIHLLLHCPILAKHAENIAILLDIVFLSFSGRYVFPVAISMLVKSPLHTTQRMFCRKHHRHEGREKVGRHCHTVMRFPLS